MIFSFATLVVGCAGTPISDKAGHPSKDSADDTSDSDSHSGSEADTEPPSPDEDSGTPVDVEPGDHARIVETLFPTDIECGESAEGVVVVQNTGTTTWSRAEGFKLGAYGDEDPLYDSEGVRVWLDDETIVAPGESYEFVIDLLGPETAGSTITDWQMVLENVHWFGEITEAEVTVHCGDEPSAEPEETPPLPLPDMRHFVVELAEEHPDLLEGSCLDDGGGWGFLDLLVDRLRVVDDRWGYNWKRGVIGDPSEDVVDYHYGSGEREDSPDVYIIDVIVGHCGESPAPGWLDQTEATADAGTIGRWTSRDRF